MTRNVWRDVEKVPKGTKVLAVRVRTPQVVMMDSETPARQTYYGGDDDVVSTESLVFVELTKEEWEEGKKSQEKADGLVVSLQQEIAAQLGMKKHRID